MKKIDTELLKKQSILTLDISANTKNSVISTDIFKFAQLLKRHVVRKIDLLVVVLKT